MEGYIFDYIKQRMTEMGYEKYHWEAVRMQGNDEGEREIKTINAYNEFYFLVAKTVEPDLVIFSDTEVFNEAADYAKFSCYNYKEFSGEIKIKQLIPVDYEFIRVIPE